MPKDQVVFYNQIDIGIFLCFLELCLNKNDINFERKLLVEKDLEFEKSLVAKYFIK